MTTTERMAQKSYQEWQQSTPAKAVLPELTEEDIVQPSTRIIDARVQGHHASISFRSKTRLDSVLVKSLTSSG